MAAPIPSRSPVSLKAKICLVGDESVGKTSLIQRFVYGVFDPSYLRTLGASVAKKTIELSPIGGRSIRLDMSILDVMGNRKFMELFREAYFNGARGIFAVADMTRRATLNSTGEWIAGVEMVVGRIPVVVAVNKADLSERAEYSLSDAESVASAYNGACVLTSALTGEGVEIAFSRLAAEVATRQLEVP